VPHLILEFSANVLDEPDHARLLLDLHQALAETGLFSLSDFKGRAVRHADFAVAEGSPDRAFVALNVQVLDGRSDEIKTRVAEICARILRAAYPRTAAGRRLSLTVQVSDIHRASYHRETSAGEGSAG
jgi:5-carboxymethyl-2-hydroxymuconate isomerase